TKILKERAFAKAQDAAKKSLGAEIELGRRFKQMEKSPGGRGKTSKSKFTSLQKLKFSKLEASEAERMHTHKEKITPFKRDYLKKLEFTDQRASEAERMHTYRKKIGKMVDEKDDKEEIVLRRDALRIITKPHITYSSGENEWYTPKIYIDAARAVMGDIDVDPASSEIANKIIRAKIYYTAQDDRQCVLIEVDSDYVTTIENRLKIKRQG
ncbi:unnamed protein product, partial [marine sediment metagenome]